MRIRTHFAIAVVSTGIAASIAFIAPNIGGAAAGVALVGIAVLNFKACLGR